MGTRKTRVRTKVTALLLSLTALWVFAAWVTLRDGLNLLWVSTLDANVGTPANALQVELQRERRLTMAYLGSGRTQERRPLDEQRARTDAAAANFKRLATSSSARIAANDELERYVADLIARLDGLAAGRASIDAGRAGRDQAMTFYTTIIDSQFRVYSELGSLDDREIEEDIRALIALVQAREVLAQEDAMLVGVLESGRITPAERRELIRLVGVQRYLHQQAAARLHPSDRARYDQLNGSDVAERFRELENTMLAGVGNRPTISVSDWNAAANGMFDGLRRIEVTGGEEVVKRANPVAVGVIVRLVLAGGLGLLAVIASIILSITTARALVQQLERLAVAARELATKRLPSVVERLGHGEKVDVEAEAPPLQFGSDAIGQVGQAFNEVQKTAIKTAVEQAELRESIRDILLNLARRTQSLVHRQLTLLDAMERRATDADELKDLFRVDHLATRMRRNAENLIVLAGASPGRAWRRPVPMVDVVRGALAEVEDYTRVSLMPIGEVSLAGRAVGDVIHLLAELVENAVSFSPPYTVVQISGHPVANGHVIEIEDRGLGMSPEDIAEANERIANPPEFNPANTAQLGLFVVSRLAEKHGIKVALKDSLYGGTTAVVLIPRELIVETGETTRVDADAPGERLALERGPAGRAEEEPRVVETVARVAAAGGRREGREVPDDWAPSVPVQRGDPQARAATERPGPAPVRERRMPEPERPARPRPPREAAPDAAGSPNRPRPAGDNRRTPEGITRKERDGRADRPAAQEEEPKASKMEYTPGGLPFRVPQASLAPALRTDGPVRREEPAPPDDRSPEEIRRIMGAFQAGTRRGRSDAARLRADKADKDVKRDQGGRPSG